MAIENTREVVRLYAEALVGLHSTGQAREHAYRPAFKQLIQSFDAGLHVVNDPARSEHGNPDFVFIRGDITVGYTETKDVGVDLDKIEKSNQMQRYLGYSNLILTDYLCFRFFKNGERYGEEIIIGEVRDGRIVLYSERFGTLADALQDFLQGTPETIRSGKRLSALMGGKARRIRDNVRAFLQVEHEKNAELQRVYETIKQLLVHDLTTDAFADMYAQTLVYGLFVARYNDETPENFSRQEARDLVPASNPFLREFFDHIVGPRFDKRLQYIVDEMCAAFAVSDVRGIVDKHLRIIEVKDEKDPIIHFYEDFLKEYDADQRKRMGAYYTPIPVVQFIIRQVDEILKRDFGLAQGLADTSKREITVQTQGMKPAKVDIHRVQILDPAVGTATFLNETIKFIHQSFKGQEGRWPSYVETDLLPRLHGFELMMAPYTIAHLKLGMTLRETGVKQLSQRLGVYLTNTLEEANKVDGTLFSFGLSQAIADEAGAASKIKHEKPIMVVIGNPPYSGVSSNETKYANSLINKYKVEPGGKEKLKERKHWLNDDYVKFIAFAEDLIEKNGEGVVAMITNNGYLDNPTFRGMRWHLATTFDNIYVLDLHGNSKKNESAKDGSKDENVFNIMQGVGIILAVKTGKKKAGELADIHHADLFGTRKNKFVELGSNVSFTKIAPDERGMYFVPRNTTGREEYEEGVCVNTLFKQNVTGIVTMGDSFIVGQERDVIANRIQKLVNGECDEDTLNREFGLGKNYAKFVLDNAAKLNFEEFKLVSYNYRPFDVRYTYFDNKVLWRWRESVMKNFRFDNLAINYCRQVISDSYSHALVSSNITDDSFVSNKSRERGYCAPLYIYSEDGIRTPNFDEKEIMALTKNLTVEYSPEDILDYIYAVLHSPEYREKYKEFLKIDFPRVPVISSDAEFARLITLGRELRGLHLLKSPKVHQFITTFPKEGSDTVDKITYKDGQVWINDEQYFGDVPQVAWEFYIGGYQPAQKWLKDRKGRKLNNEDIGHYQQMIVALIETGRVMREIDHA